MAEFWLAADLELGDATHYRFGGDEAEASDLIANVSFATQSPGGFGDASFVIARSEWTTRDALLFSPVRIYGPGDRTFYEGRVKEISQVDRDSIRLDCEGWAAHLDDDESFRQLYVSRDLGAWYPATRQRRLNLYSLFRHVADPTIEGDASIPSVALLFEEAWVNPVGVASFDPGPGQTISSIYYDMTSASTAAYVGQIGTVSDQVATAQDYTADLLTGASSSAAGTHTPTAAYRYGELLFYFAGTVAAGQDQHFTVRRLAVFGDHGLAKNGAAPDEGYLGSQILGHAVAVAAPMLRSDSESIEQSSYVLTHLVHEQGTVRELVEQVTSYGGAASELNDWGVYENRTFFWRSPGTHGRVWRVRRDQVAVPTEDGPSAGERFGGVVVSYTDAAGTTKTVGPLQSGADYETAQLTDPDENNPALRVPNRIVRRDVGLTTQDGAVLLGQALLAEQNAATRRGSVTITGTARDDAGVEHPAAAVRACDRVVIEDEAGVTPATQYVNATSYDHDTATMTASLGLASHKVEIVLAQLAAAVRGL